VAPEHLCAAERLALLSTELMQAMQSSRTKSIRMDEVLGVEGLMLVVQRSSSADQEKIILLLVNAITGGL
jgi:hypothetical protein